MADIDSSLPIHTFNQDALGATAANVIVGIFDSNEIRINPLTEAGFTAGMITQTAGLTAQMVTDTAGVTGALATQTAGLTAQMVTDAAGITLAIHDQTVGLTAQMATDVAGITGAIATNTAGVTGAIVSQTAGLTAQMITDTAGITAAVKVASDRLPAALGATASAGSLSVVMATDQVPMPVYITDKQSSTQVNKYLGEDKAYLSASTNTYNPPTSFVLDRVWASGSGRIKLEVVVAGATGWVGFNSTSNPNVEVNCSDTVVTSAQSVTAVVTNIESGKTQTLYSTIVGNL